MMPGGYKIYEVQKCWRPNSKIIPPPPPSPKKNYNNDNHKQRETFVITFLLI